MIFRFMTSLIVLALVGCSGGSDEPVATTGDTPEVAELRLAAVQYKDNKAVLFAGSGEHKEFMAEVIPAVASWFDEQDIGFQSTHYADQTVAEIKQHISETAAAMSADGTLAIYFLTHGSPDGYMLAKDRLFRMSEIVQTLKTARTTPLKRLFIFVETCYSGNQINAFGLTAPTASPLPLELTADDPMLGGLGGEGFSLLEGNPFQEAVIVTSSKNNQVSWVPVFSNALYQSFIDFNYEDDATIRQWLGKVKEHVLADAPQAQEPMFKGIPDSVLDKKLWMDERKPESGGTEIAADLLTNPISPDGITQDQVEEAKQDQGTADEDDDQDKAGDDDKDDKSGKGKVDKDEDSGESDGADDGDKPKKKKKTKSKSNDDKKGGGGGSQCGTVGGGVTVNASALLLTLLLPLLIVTRQSRGARKRA